MGTGGGEGQPFSIESRDWLRSQILGKTIYCQLLKREGMYGRMVGLLLGCALRPKLEKKTDSSPLPTTKIPAMVVDWKPWDQPIGGERPMRLGIRLRIGGWRVPTPP